MAGWLGGSSQPSIGQSWAHFGSDRVDRLNERQKGFFGNCKKVKVGERDEEFQKIRAEYTKVIEDSNEKIQNAEECYNLIIEEAGSGIAQIQTRVGSRQSGITEILEKRSLEMDNPPPNPAKENRHPKKHGSSSSAGSSAHRKGHQTIAHGSNAGSTPSTSSSANHKKSFVFPSDPMLDGNLGPHPHSSAFWIFSLESSITLVYSARIFWNSSSRSPTLTFLQLPKKPFCRSFKRSTRSVKSKP
ncbi:hypothetical protein TCAL_15963 [Tigriopus californicus]|uniref:Inhibitor of growth protein N-terminal histone-binding domain-containing protein n=1 Tax=Tigriopus californicus TaxID=6832 RepID=A0A553PFI3_TIGCA|nr:hypothetical protein TCAL_15963 [Tigriopus californicus]